MMSFNCKGSQQQTSTQCKSGSLSLSFISCCCRKNSPQEWLNYKWKHLYNVFITASRGLPRSKNQCRQIPTNIDRRQPSAERPRLRLAWRSLNADRRMELIIFSQVKLFGRFVSFIKNDKKTAVMLTLPNRGNTYGNS